MPNPQIQTDYTKHEILKQLNEQHSVSTEELFQRHRGRLSHVSRNSFKAGQLDLLRIAGLIALDEEDDTWAITEAGAERLSELNKASKKQEVDLTQVVRSNLHIPSGTYDGKELRNLSMREGAYDAYKLPSKFGRKENNGNV